MTKVHELLDEPEKWTKGTAARNAAGEVTSCRSPSAVCWCLAGAVFVCYPSRAFDVICQLSKQLECAIGDWNDSHTFEDVRNLALELDI